MNNQRSAKQDRRKVYLAVIILANVLLLLLFAFANYSVYLQVNKEGYSIYGWSPLNFFIAETDQSVHMTPVMYVPNLPFYVFCLAIAVNLAIAILTLRKYGAPKR